MQPYDYSSQLQAPSFVDSYTSGLNIGIARDNALIAQQQKQQAMLKQQQAMEQAQKKQAILDEYYAKQTPTYEDTARLMAVFPEQAEHFKKGWDVRNEGQKQSAWSKASQLQAALESDNPEIAKTLASQFAEAAKNSGIEKDAQGYQSIADLIDKSPESARRLGAMFLMSVDPEKGKTVIEGAQKLRMQGTEQRKAEAEATSAEVGAKFAEREKLAALEEKGWNIKNVQSLIQDRKADQAIKAMQVQLSKEDNTLKRQELQLKLDERIAAKDEKVAAKVADFEAGQAQINDTRQLLGEIFSDESSLRAVTGALAFKGAIPGTENRAMAQKIERLQNSLAMGNLDKLKGAISDKDIAFLKSASASLDRYQDEDQFIKELRRIESTLNRADDALSRKFGVPRADRRPASERIPGQGQSDVRSQADAILRGG